MLLNSAFPAVISAQNRKTKKTVPGCATPVHMGDLAGTTEIMGLDLERCCSDMATSAASVIYDITLKFLRIARLFF